MLPPGGYNRIDPDSEVNPPPVNIKCYSIQILTFEKGAETFYWVKGELKAMITGD